MGVRELRLEAEYEAMQGFHSDVLEWEAVGHNVPPDTYHITYQIRSIIGFEGGEPVYRSRHQVEIQFPSTYPRTPPIVNMITKPYVLHPNIFKGGKVCIEDRWRPVGMYLDTVCELVGQLIAYQKWNVNSPAHRHAEMLAWLDAHQQDEDVIPTDNRQIRLPAPADTIVWGVAAEEEPPSTPPSPRPARIQW